MILEHGKPYGEGATVNVDDALLDRIESIAKKATPGPWRNLCNEWNQAQQDYYKRHGMHYHGHVRGARRQSAKHCATLIVRDSFQGQPIQMKDWKGYPDYYDLKRIIAEPADAMFHTRRTHVMAEGTTWDDLPEGRANADLIALCNPATMLALVKALRDARRGGGDAKA